MPLLKVGLAFSNKQQPHSRYRVRRPVLCSAGCNMLGNVNSCAEFVLHHEVMYRMCQPQAKSSRHSPPPSPVLLPVTLREHVKRQDFLAFSDGCRLLTTPLLLEAYRAKDVSFAKNNFFSQSFAARAVRRLSYQIRRCSRSIYANTAGPLLLLRIILLQ